MKLIELTPSEEGLITDFHEHADYFMLYDLKLKLAIIRLRNSERIRNSLPARLSPRQHLRMAKVKEVESLSHSTVATIPISARFYLERLNVLLEEINATR